MYMWGRGKDGRLGNGDADGRFFPTRVAAPLASVAVRHVAVGMRHTVAVTRDGAVYAWGKGKDWQVRRVGWTPPSAIPAAHQLRRAW